MADGRKVNFPLTESDRIHLPLGQKNVPKCFLVLIMNTCIHMHIFISSGDSISKLSVTDNLHQM